MCVFALGSRQFRHLIIILLIASSHIFIYSIEFLFLSLSLILYVQSNRIIYSEVFCFDFVLLNI